MCGSEHSICFSHRPHFDVLECMRFLSIERVPRPGTSTGILWDGSGWGHGECPLPCQLRPGWQAPWQGATFFPPRNPLSVKDVWVGTGTSGNLPWALHGGWGRGKFGMGEAESGQDVLDPSPRQAAQGQNQKGFQVVVWMVRLSPGEQGRGLPKVS